MYRFTLFSPFTPLKPYSPHFTATHSPYSYFVLTKHYRTVGKCVDIGNIYTPAHLMIRPYITFATSTLIQSYLT